MTCVHSQSLGRANDRTLAALSAAMVMARLERIVSSVDKNRPTYGRRRRSEVSQKMKLLSILECNTCFGNHAITVPKPLQLQCQSLASKPKKPLPPRAP